MNNSSIPNHPHLPDTFTDGTSHYNDEHYLNAKALQHAALLHRAVTLYKVWSFGPVHQINAQPPVSLMRNIPFSRRFLVALRAKSFLLKRNNRARRQSPIAFDNNQEEDYLTQEIGSEYKIEGLVKADNTHNSDQNQQHHGGGNSKHSNEEHKALAVRPAHLRLALAKPRTTFNLPSLDDKLSLAQRAAYALDHFTQALLCLRDKGTQGKGGDEQANLKLRPLVQELVLCLLAELLCYGTVPMTKLDAVRQYLIDASLEHEKNSQEERPGQRQKKEKDEKDKEEEEKEEQSKTKKRSASSLPQSIQNLNLLTPLLVLNSQRPSKAEQLKLAQGRLKSVIRTATK